MNRFLVFLAAVALSGGAALASEAVVEQPWARASLTANGVVYLSITNPSGAVERLVGVETPVAAHAMLMTNAGGHRTVDAWEIPAGGRLEAGPAGEGLHIMLMDLRAPLKKGEVFPLTLRFADGDARTVDVRVHGPGAMKPE